MFVKLLLVAAVVILAVAVVARGSSGAGDQRTYVVQPSDTLWSIAVRHYAGDPREGVWKLQRRNALDGTLLVPGQQLTLP
jgi:LysM repeat protein